MSSLGSPSKREEAKTTMDLTFSGKTIDPELGLGRVVVQAGISMKIEKPRNKEEEFYYKVRKSTAGGFPEFIKYDDVIDRAKNTRAC